MIIGFEDSRVQLRDLSSKELLFESEGYEGGVVKKAELIIADKCAYLAVLLVLEKNKFEQQTLL